MPDVCWHNFWSKDFPAEGQIIVVMDASGDMTRHTWSADKKGTLKGIWTLDPQAVQPDECKTYPSVPLRRDPSIY